MAITMSPQQVTDLQNRLEVLNFDIETMRNSEGTPFYSEELLENLCAEALQIEQTLHLLCCDLLLQIFGFSSEPR